MSATTGLVLVMVFGFVVGRVTQRVRERFVIPAAPLYPVVGILAGPQVLGVLDEAFLDTVQPILSLLLGLVGFGMGLLLRRELSRGRGLEAGVVGGVMVIGAVGASTYGLLYLCLPAASDWSLVWPAVAVAAVAGVVDHQIIGQLADRAGSRGPIRELLHTLAISSSLVAVAVFGLALALARAREGASGLNVTPSEWLLAALAVGVACGLLFTVFVGKWGSDQRAFLATVGIVTFASGMASAMGISPLLVGLLAGLTASVVSDQARVVGEALETLEAPAFVVVLTFAGAMWSPPSPWLWGVVGVAIVLRWLALRTAASIGPRLFQLPRGHRLGAALVPQGALGAAIAANFAQVYPESASVVLTFTIASLVLSDLIGFRAIRRVLADAGEITHQAVVGAEVT